MDPALLRKRLLTTSVGNLEATPTPPQQITRSIWRFADTAFTHGSRAWRSTITRRSSMLFPIRANWLPAIETEPIDRPRGICATTGNSKVASIDKGDAAPAPVFAALTTGAGDVDAIMLLL